MAYIRFSRSKPELLYRLHYGEFHDESKVGALNTVEVCAVVDTPIKRVSTLSMYVHTSVYCSSNGVHRIT